MPDPAAQSLGARGGKIRSAKKKQAASARASRYWDDVRAGRRKRKGWKPKEGPHQ